MNKKYFWKLSTIVVVAIMSFCFASCGGDDQETIEPVTDGLEGYWYDLYYQKVPVYTSYVDQPFYSYGGRFFYLDGKGGGTYYSGLIGEASWNDLSYMEKENYPHRITFKDYKEYTHTFYTHRGKAIIYARVGSTINIVSSDGEVTFMVNVAEDGTLSGYHRVTKVN